jgi:hypothetical protein
MRGSKTNTAFAVLTVIAAGAMIYGAFRIAGFLGIVVLGILTIFVATQIDLDKEGAIGGVQNANMYAKQAEARQQWSRAEKAAHRAEMATLELPILIGKLLGAALIGIGTIGMLRSSRSADRVRSQHRLRRLFFFRP